MISQSVAIAAGGASEVSATTGEIQAAFLSGAVISLLAIVAEFFVRKPVVALADSPAPIS